MTTSYPWYAIGKHDRISILCCAVVLWYSHLATTSKIHLVKDNAMQSSSADATKYGADTAVDGKTYSAGGTSTCTQTSKYDKSPWWRIKLDKTYLVQYVKLNNNMQDPERLSNFTIRVGTMEAVAGQSVCRFYDKMVTPGGSDIIKCTRPLLGVYISIQKSNTASGSNILTICEFGAYGYGYIQVQGKNATQSSSWLGVRADGAIDGFHYSANPSSCFHTNEEEEPWWQVDLVGAFIISAVRIYNRAVWFRRLRELDVKVGFHATEAALELCNHFIGPVPKNTGALIECINKVKGRYVRIIKLKKGRAELTNDGKPAGFLSGYLILCEVEVFGHAEQVVCGDPGTPIGTTKSGTSYLYNDVVRYNCDRGWETRSGDTERTCQAHGTWSGSAISCRKVSCDDPGTPPGAVKYGNSYLHGDSINYTCSKGWERQHGHINRMCLSNNTWSGSSIVCKKFCETGTNIGTVIGCFLAGVALVLMANLVIYLLKRRRDSINAGLRTITRAPQSPEHRRVGWNEEGSYVEPQPGSAYLQGGQNLGSQNSIEMSQGQGRGPGEHVYSHIIPDTVDTVSNQTLSTPAAQAPIPEDLTQ